jgi:hypothetical protein
MPLKEKKKKRNKKNAKKNSISCVRSGDHDPEMKSNAAREVTCAHSLKRAGTVRFSFFFGQKMTKVKFQ